MKILPPAAPPDGLLFDRLSVPDPALDFSSYRPLLQTAHLLLAPAFCRRGLLQLEVQACSTAAGQPAALSVQLWLGPDVLEAATGPYTPGAAGQPLNARLELMLAEGVPAVYGTARAGDALLQPAWQPLQSLPNVVLGGRPVRVLLASQNLQPQWLRLRARLGQP